MTSNSEKIGAEELQCKAMADNAQRDLDEALPALEEAMKVGVCPVAAVLIRSLCVLDSLFSMNVRTVFSGIDSLLRVMSNFCTCDRSLLC